MKIRWHCNIDKLVATFGFSQELYLRLSRCEVGGNIEYDGFFLKILSNDGLPDNIQSHTKIKVAVCVDGYGAVCDICFTNSRKFQSAVLTVHNKTFYTVTHDDEKKTAYCFVPKIAGMLGLTLKTVRELETAKDSNTNPCKEVRRLVSDYANYEMYWRGNKIENETEELNGFGEFAHRNRKTVSKQKTIVMRMANNDNVQAKIYWKQREAETNKKQYINDFNGWATTSWRTEVKTFNDDVELWLKHCSKSKDDFLRTENKTHFLYRLSEEVYRFRFWRYQIRRLLWFVNKETKNEIDLFSIINKKFT